jgi:hypothetical protein
VSVPACDYPGCEAAAAGSRGLVVQPEPIAVTLCEAHLAIVDSNRATQDTLDFWRWFNAVSGITG